MHQVTSWERRESLRQAPRRSGVGQARVWQGLGRGAWLSMWGSSTHLASSCLTLCHGVQVGAGGAPTC